MSYKVKSLLYFTCLLASTILYYSMDHNLRLKTSNTTVELAEVDIDNIPSSEVMAPEDFN